jgi:hypothetical protein
MSKSRREGKSQAQRAHAHQINQNQPRFQEVEAVTPKSAPNMTLIEEIKKLRAILEKIFESFDKPNTTKKWMDRAQLILLMLTAGGALWQSELTREALNATKLNFAQDERPYIWLANNKDQPDFIDYDDSHKVIQWTYHLTNYGKSLAKDIHVVERYKILGGEEQRSYDVRQNLFMAPLPPSTIQNNTITTNPETTVIKDANDANHLLSMPGFLWIKVRITYSDLSGNKYDSQFCLMTLSGTATASQTMFCPVIEDTYMH